MHTRARSCARTASVGSRAVAVRVASRASAAEDGEYPLDGKWVAFNAIAKHLDYGRRYTRRTNQVQRSFEDTALKQRALELVLAT
jgi:hypothetical protein